MLTWMYTGIYTIPEDSVEGESSTEAIGTSASTNCTDTANVPAQTAHQPLDGLDRLLEYDDAGRILRLRSPESTPPSSCGCNRHSSPPRERYTPQTFLTRSNALQQHKSQHDVERWTADGEWELYTCRQWTCCHGFLQGFGTDGPYDCTLPCACLSPGTPENISIHAFMYAAADYFDVPALKDLALENFKAAAHIHNRTEAFAQAIRDVFTSAMPEATVTPRTVVIDIRVDLPTLWEYEPVRQVLNDIGAVTLAVLKRRTEMQEAKDKQGLIHGWQLEKLGLGKGVVEKRQWRGPPLGCATNCGPLPGRATNCGGRGPGGPYIPRPPHVYPSRGPSVYRCGGSGGRPPHGRFC